MARSTIEVDAASIISDTLEKVREQAAIIGVLGEVLGAVNEAREKHGAQMHLPLGQGEHARYLSELFAVADIDGTLLTNAEFEQAAKLLTDVAARNQAVTWSHIALEEVAEFLGAKTVSDAREEALQAAAMFTSIVTVIDAAAGR